MTNGTLCNCKGFNEFYPIVYCSKNIIYDFFGSYFRVVENIFCFLFDVFIIASFGIAFSHGTFIKTRTSGDDKSCHFFGIHLGMVQSNMTRSEEHTFELQSRPHLVCRLLLEKKKYKKQNRL